VLIEGELVVGERNVGGAMTSVSDFPRVLSAELEDWCNSYEQIRNEQVL
jgi:hypothetical protein